MTCVAGAAKPRIEGESYYWTTPSGKTIVRHPNAYGWRTLYHASPLRVAAALPAVAVYELLGSWHGDEHAIALNLQVMAYWWDAPESLPYQPSAAAILLDLPFLLLQQNGVTSNNT